MRDIPAATLSGQEAADGAQDKRSNILFAIEENQHFWDRREGRAVQFDH